MDERDLWKDPCRRYMIPAARDRHPEWPNHPMASRDSLHESDMWVVEGLTHRYPTKVLAELLSTCPQYCGHCTRMDLVGGNTAQVVKHGFGMAQKERLQAILEYLRAHPVVRDVVVSGGQKWARAGVGSGFLAVSDRARDHLTPVWSSYTGSQDPYASTVEPPAEGAAAFQVSHADPVAAGRFAAALEEIAAVGIPVLHAEIARNVSRLIDLADEFALPVVSPRAEAERAGIVVVEPLPEQLTVLVASLHNHGITARVGDTSVRLSAHATVEEETFSMLRAAFVSFATSI